MSNKVIFTSASDTDGDKITTTTLRLETTESSDGVPRSLLTADSRIIVTIKVPRKTLQVVFTPNRKDKNGFYSTAATNAWPRALRKPKLGKSVSYEVVGVTYV